ncbi:hypothetical protein GCM10018966_022120 [Streptomyces yanii]
MKTSRKSTGAAVGDMGLAALLRAIRDRAVLLRLVGDDPQRSGCRGLVDQPDRVLVDDGPSVSVDRVDARADGMPGRFHRDLVHFGTGPRTPGHHRPDSLSSPPRAGLLSRFGRSAACAGHSHSPAARRSVEGDDNGTTRSGVRGGRARHSRG